MSGWYRWGLLLAGVYLATGFYTVGGNELGVIRRCGRAARPLVSSGLHYDLPWPWSRVDRVPLNVVRTVSVGTLDQSASAATAATTPATNNVSGNAVVLPASFTPDRLALTGDKNLVRYRIVVQYRLSAAAVEQYLFGESAPEQRLRLAAEATATELIAARDVDTLQTSGRAALNAALTVQLRHRLPASTTGMEIEQAVFERIDPPATVKPEFLDTANARADFDRLRQEAKTEAEKLLADALSSADRERDRARGDRQQRLSRTAAEVTRFDQLLTRIEALAHERGVSHATARGLVCEQLAWEAIRTLLPRLARQIIVPPGESHLQVLPDSETNAAPATP